jgi:hypothetical protein
MANTNLTSIVDSYGCMSNYQEMKAFFTNPKNSRGVQDALNKYGVPVENRKSYHTGLGIFGKWHDPCDWQNILKFYQYAKLSVQFPTLTNPTIDCSKVASSLVALNALSSTASSIQDANTKTAFNEALTDKIAEYQAFDNNNNCATVLSTRSTSSTMKNVGIYAIGGLVLVLGIAFAIRLTKK